MRKPTDGSALDASVRNFAGRTPFCQLLGSQNPDFPDLQVRGVFLFFWAGVFFSHACMHACGEHA